MAVNITAVDVLNNPSMFTDPLLFEIQYEALQRLEGDLEFKLIYVGSADDESKDQVLDEVLLGPVEFGNYRFAFEADAPDPALIPKDDIVGVTVILLTCSYKEQELIRVGYYVANEYEDAELKENPPVQPIIEKLHRTIIADNPRVTRFHVDFDQPPGSVPMEDAAAPASQAGAAGAVMEAQEGHAYSNENLPDPNAMPTEGQFSFGAMFKQQQQQAYSDAPKALEEWPASKPDTMVE